MFKEDLIPKFNEMYSNTLSLEYIKDQETYTLMSQDKIKVACKKCNHSWFTSMQNVFVFRAGCYDCCRGKGYSMDEIKILSYIKDNYIPKEHWFSFKHAEHGGQINIRPKPPKNIPGFTPPYFYSCDGFTRVIYEYNKEEKRLYKIKEHNLKGTVFEVFGDYHHSNPLYSKPNDTSCKNGMTHKQNYEYTMNRIKHIEEQGYKVFYIWITDFRRFTRELERYNREEIEDQPNLFDYMNIEKKPDPCVRVDYSLLAKGTKKILSDRNLNSFNDFE